jgi:hypothetical protein
MSKKKIEVAGDQTEGPAHARQRLNHSATPNLSTCFYGGISLNIVLSLFSYNYTQERRASRICEGEMSLSFLSWKI